MRIRDFPIRVNLALLILFASCLAVFLASIGFAVYERHNARASAQREVTALADSLGANAAASLAFSDQKTAEEMLGSMANEPQVVAAFLYDSRGRLFTAYRRANSSRWVIAPAWRSDGAQFDSRNLTLFRGVYMNGERVGSISLVFDLTGFRSLLYSYVQIATLVLVLSVLIAFLISLRLAHSIGSPLVQLSAVARRISTEKDYSVRANIRAGGEAALLIHSFNNMLSQIESSERALKGALKSLRESEERYALAARGANDGLWDWNLVTNEIYFSPRWNHMLGLSESERWTTPDHWFQSIHPSDRERAHAELDAHCDGKTPELVSEYRMRHKSGGYIWTLSRGIAVRNESGKAIRIAGSLTDITEGKIADPLTQIPNRLYFMDRIESAIEDAMQNKSLFAVLFIDLDDFKPINDSLGHAAGDELLIAVAGRLRSSIRTNGQRRGRSQSELARIGGDEFAILLSPIKRESDAAAVAKRILERITEPIYFEGQRMFVSASIGIAFNSSGATPEDLLRNADTAMHAAKTAGKARMEFFNESMRAGVIARFETETGLRKAVDAEQLVVHYQPIVALQNGRIHGFETLVRWNHPERGLILPGEFIPIAEESDLIFHIGCWVLREACRQMAEWQGRLKPSTPLTISVNVSSRQLGDLRLVDDISRVLAETGLPPESLVLEVTESSIMDNTEQTLDSLHRLRAMGIRLEIDDFGTGYSSLSYLRRLPFGALKIDRSFIHDLSAGNGSIDIVRAILELAQSLKLEVIAEGVETEEQLRKLIDMGFKYVQGYLISRPLDAATAERLYEDHRNHGFIEAALL